MTTPHDVDVLILGGGSAGCVLASRLSARADLRVALAEAGSDTPPGAVPAEIASSYPGRAYFNARYSWPDLQVALGGAHFNDATQRPIARYEQARVMGGGSSINGIGVNYGAPADYEEWHESGATGWRWRDVEPFFRKAERDLDFPEPPHGREGPIPVRRIPPARWSGFTRAILAELTSRGFTQRPDQNGAWEDGVMPTSVNLDQDWRRVSTATGYLSAAVRARANLAVLPQHTARKLIFDGRRVIGAELAHAGGVVRIAARSVFIACGAIHTPALLMRNGIGPAHALRTLGIDIVADRRGVGANLMEHPATNLSCLLRPGARLASRSDYHIQMMLRFSSGHAAAPTGDMHMAIVSQTAWHALGYRLGSLVFWVNKSYSRGEVQLRSADPHDSPRVDFRLLSDHRDLVRLMQSFRLAASILTAPALDPVRRIAFPTFMSDRIRRIAQPSRRNAFLLATLAAYIDATGAHGDELMRRLASRDVDLAALVADDDALAAYLARATTGVWHASGTARMGAADDPLAVTDPAGAVHGVQGLHVCDASLMPTIPCANLNLPIIMMAEKIAETLKPRL